MNNHVANMGEDTSSIPNGTISPPEPNQEVFSMDLLTRELPFVDDGQVPLGELLSRVVQAVYAEMNEFAETFDFLAFGFVDHFD